MTVLAKLVIAVAVVAVSIAPAIAQEEESPAFDPLFRVASPVVLQANFVSSTDMPAESLFPARLFGTASRPFKLSLQLANPVEPGVTVTLQKDDINLAYGDSPRE